MSIMGPVWGPDLLLDTTQYDASRPLQKPRYVEVAKSEKSRPNCADDVGPQKSGLNPP